MGTKRLLDASVSFDITQGLRAGKRAKTTDDDDDAATVSSVSDISDISDVSDSDSDSDDASADDAGEDGEEDAQKKKKAAAVPAGPKGSSANPSPLHLHDEVHRCARVKWLRSKLAKECKASGVKVPLLCFERWAARSALREKEAPTFDPLLPSGLTDEAFVRDLKRGGVKEAEKVAFKMLRHAVSARAALAAGGSEEDKVKGDVWVDEEKYYRVDLHVGEHREYQTLNKPYYDKAWELYEAENGQARPGEATKAFHEKLFMVLCRYASLGGHGYQAGLVPEAFDVLHTALKVNFECFASPLNCRYPKFCSAFLDTDEPFGSLGSFFNFKPKEGSFEANPPFVPEVMTTCVEHIHRLLRAPDARQLSFCVVVPAWREVRAWTVLEGSRYLRSHFRVPAAAHSFTDGAQHYRPDHHRPSSYDSGIFVLQNDEGAAAYPVPETMEAQLREAMRGSCASEPSRTSVSYV